MTLFGKESRQINILLEVLAYGIIIVAYVGVCVFTYPFVKDCAAFIRVSGFAFLMVVLLKIRTFIVLVLENETYFLKQRIKDALVDNKYTTVEEIVAYAYNNCSLLVRMIYTKKIMNNFVVEVYEDNNQEIFAKVCLAYPKMSNVIPKKVVLFTARFKDLETFLIFKPGWIK